MTFPERFFELTPNAKELRARRTGQTIESNFLWLREQISELARETAQLRHELANLNVRFGEQLELFKKQ